MTLNPYRHPCATPDILPVLLGRAVTLREYGADSTADLLEWAACEIARLREEAKR